MKNKPILTALRQAASGDSLSAAFVLGRLYDEGWGVQSSARTAFRWYKTAAEGGLSEAFYFVASSYYFGHGVRISKPRAYFWFRRASEAGDLTGSYMEAVCLIDGTGVKRDVKRGMRLLRRAAQKGAADAMDYLADYYIKIRKPKEARLWARKAIRAGDRIAATRLPAIRQLEHGSALLRR